MSYSKNVWTDRDVQFPHRYKDQNNNQLTLTRDEGTINAAGTLINAAKMNNIELGIETLDTSVSDLDTVINSGWIPANEIWTYSSIDDPTGVIYATGDVTTKYSAGMRVKMTNAGNLIYGLITVVGSYDSGNDRTPITFLHEIDPTDSLALHLLEDSAITNTYYSNVKAPFGFPLSPDKWSIKLYSTSNYSKTIGVNYESVNSALAIDLDIGIWNINYGCVVESTGAGTFGIARAGLRLADNTIVVGSETVSKTNPITYLKGFGRINNTTKQKLNLVNSQAWTGGNSAFSVTGANPNDYGMPIQIIAFCDYL